MVLGDCLRVMVSLEDGCGGMILMGVCMRCRTALFVEMGSTGVRITRLVSFWFLDLCWVLITQVYLNDSVGQKSFAFDFDLETGSISNRRLIVDMRGTSGEPDGLVVE